MATTGYVDFTAAVRAIGDRTDAAGVAVGDYSAEEDRLIQAVFTAGTLTPDAFVVAASSGMTVEVGSSAKDDLYAVEGTVAGQGVYLCRLDGPAVQVALAASDPSQARTDELYLVIADSAYDGGTVSLPRVGVRTGDPGGGAPGPDVDWKASALLARVTVGAGVASVGGGDIADQRVPATLRSHVSDGIVPIGTVIDYACPVLPGGVWMAPQGQAISRTTYATLFSRMQTTWGAGDGSTTFNLPDLRNRRAVGASASKPLGSTGGSETRSLAVGNLPSHTHTINHNHDAVSTSSGGVHWHAYLRSNGLGGSANRAAQGDLVVQGDGSTENSGSHSHTVDLPNYSGSSGSVGSGSAFNIEDPWAGLQKLIRVA